MVTQESTTNTDALPAKSRERGEVRLVPLETRHWPGVLALYAEVFGEAAVQTYRQRIGWTLQENLHPELTKGWVLESGDASVVGYLAALPGRFRIGGETLIAHTPADYMVHPDYRFHGIKLMKEFFSACENVATVDDMAATLKVLKWMKAKDSGEFVRYRKILDARALGTRRNLSAVPSFAWRPLRKALSLATWFQTAKRAPRGVRIGPLKSGFDAMAELCARADANSASPVRDSAYFRWRYGENSPQKDVSIAGATDSHGNLLGYIIYVAGAGRHRVGYVLDVTVLPDAAGDVAAALMAYAVKQLRRSGAWSIRYYRFGAERSLTGERLHRMGFYPRRGYRLITKFKDERLSAIAQDETSWRFSFGDSESSYTLE